MRVSAENLCMKFNDAGREIEIFKNLNLEIESGSSVAIVGESGVGKTTLLSLLGALELPVSGTVRIGEQSYAEIVEKGEDIAGFRGNNVGFVFQFHYLLAEFDAVENVAMPLLIQGVSQEDARTRARELLTRVGLAHRFEHRPGALSGGEQQRVAVARAFAGRPGVVLADEPTGNLDSKTGNEVNTMLRELQKDEGITLVIVTHSVDLAKTMDRVVELTPEGLKEK